MTSTRPALPMTGGCPCGAIRYQIESFPLLLYSCNCTNCQRTSGSAFALNMPVAAKDFRILQGEPKGWRRRSSSGADVTSWFCGDCGGRIYGERAGRPHSMTLRAGTNATRPAPTISGRWPKRGARCGLNFSRKNSSIFTEPYDVGQV